MLVYGDPQFHERLNGLVTGLRERLLRTRVDDLEALRGLVVDEGPGISGSSMAAVARALAQHGVSDINWQKEPGSGQSLFPPGRAWAELQRWAHGSARRDSHS